MSGFAKAYGMLFEASIDTESHEYFVFYVTSDYYSKYIITDFKNYDTFDRTDGKYVKTSYRAMQNLNASDKELLEMAMNHADLTKKV